MQLQSVDNQSQWDALPISCWQHTWEYGEVQKVSNRLISRYILADEDSHTVGFFQMITYPLFKGKTISYIPYGPVFLYQPSVAQLQELKKILQDLGRKMNSLAVRTELPDNNVFKKLPLFAYKTSFHQARGEVILDILPPINDIESNFSKSTRRNINKAQKNDLQTQFFHGSQMLDQLDNFIAINNTNTASHNTTTHSKQYFENLFSVLSKNNNNFAAVVTDTADTVLAINIFTVFNKYCYCPFGASTDGGKKSGAYYKIKIDSIVYMKQRGITEFNWGGISIGKNDSNLSGLNSFKLGFGGKEKHHNNFYDVVISRFWYCLHLARSIRKNYFN